LLQAFFEAFGAIAIAATTNSHHRQRTVEDGQTDDFPVPCGEDETIKPVPQRESSTAKQRKRPRS
jgi:hypothetical protein